jgi:hypothetical protein
MSKKAVSEANDRTGFTDTAVMPQVLDNERGNLIAEENGCIPHHGDHEFARSPLKLGNE